MNELIQDAIQHYEYGISHDIFSEPVTTYARLAVKALRRDPEHESLLNRWENVRIYEPGENVRTIGSNCEVLIKGADLLALMNPEPRQLTLDELRQMDGQPVWIGARFDRTDFSGWVIFTGDSNGQFRFNGVASLFEMAYGKTWLAYDRPPGGEGL